MTQPWCSTPWSSPTIVGIAVPTIDWSSEDRNIDAMSAPKITHTVRGVSTTSGLPPSTGGAAVEEAMRIRFGQDGRGRADGRGPSSGGGEELVAVRTPW